MLWALAALGRLAEVLNVLFRCVDQKNRNTLPPPRSAYASAKQHALLQCRCILLFLLLWECEALASTQETERARVSASACPRTSLLVAAVN